MKQLIALLLIYLLIGCSKGVHQNTSEINRIELASTKMKFAGGVAISIDSSLLYKYARRKYKDYNYYSGRITPQFWDTITKKLEEINFKTIPLTDNTTCCDDVIEFELIVHWRNKQRRIIRITRPGPDSVYNTLEWIRDSYKYVKLNHINDSIKFETSLQLPIEEPPPPRKSNR